MMDGDRNVSFDVRGMYAKEGTLKNLAVYPYAFSLLFNE